MSGKKTSTSPYARARCCSGNGVQKKSVQDNLVVCWHCRKFRNLNPYSNPLCLLNFLNTKTHSRGRDPFFSISDFFLNLEWVSSKSVFVSQVLPRSPPPRPPPTRPGILNTVSPNNIIQIKILLIWHSMDHGRPPASLVVVSNRLPFVLKRDEAGGLSRKARWGMNVHFPEKKREKNTLNFEFSAATSTRWHRANRGREENNETFFL